jgi:hypothetical protein
MGANYVPKQPQRILLVIFHGLRPGERAFSPFSEQTERFGGSQGRFDVSFDSNNIDLDGGLLLNTATYGRANSFWLDP